tara:strand:+ start:36 stop:323 length:288 start_codon:yes stop_codon:yes gene_type:complete
MKDFSKNVPEWDCKFIDLKDEDIFPLLRAAHYLDAADLLELVCAKVSSMYLKGETPEEIRKIYNLPEKETEEEKEYILKNFPFLKDAYFSENNKA